MPPITKTEWAAFIPIIWAQMILDQVRARLRLALLVSHDFENEVANIGDTVRIGKIGALSAVDKVAGTAVTRQAPAGSSQDLVLNKHKIVPFTVEDIAAAQSNPAAMMKQIKEAVRAIATIYEDDLFTAIFTGATGAIGVSATDHSETLALLTMKTLDDANCPDDVPRYSVISTKDNNALMTTSSSKFSKANERGDGGAALRTGYIGDLYGLSFFKSTRVPGPAPTKNVAFISEAVQVAVRPLPPPPPDVGAKGAVAYDAQSGLAVRVVAQYDIANVGLAVNADLLYGIKVIRPEYCVAVTT